MNRQNSDNQPLGRMYLVSEDELLSILGSLDIADDRLYDARNRVANARKRIQMMLEPEREAAT